MRRAQPSRLLAAALALAALGGTTAAAFSSVAGGSGNRVSAAQDFRAPLASAAVVAKTAPRLAGRVRQGGSYYVYASADDSGNPPAGIASITADVSAITAGAGAVPLVAGSYTAEGIAYGFRSAALTADAVLLEGSRAYSLTLSDADQNTRQQGGFAVVVDNTSPGAADVQAPTAGTAGRAEAGDTVVLTTDEQLDPNTVLAGWTGAPTDVVVRIVDDALLLVGLGNDVLSVYDAANSDKLPLGEVDLGRKDYAGGLLGGHASFGATGTKSRMSMSGSTITVTLGTAGGSVLTAAGSGTMTWLPSAQPTDGAANPMSTASRAESGPADREF